MDKVICFFAMWILMYMSGYAAASDQHWFAYCFAFLGGVGASFFEGSILRGARA